MKIVEFFKSTKNEMSHVVWPKRREVIISTIVVVIASVLIAYFLGVFDLIFGKGLGIIINL